MAWVVERDRLRAEEDREQNLRVLRDLGEIGHDVLGVERDEDRRVDLAAELLDDSLVLLIMAVAPCVVGRDDGPGLAEIVVGPWRAGGGQRVGVGAGAERIARAL